MSGFQRTVNQQPAPAVAGDFASANPRANTLAGEGAFVSGDEGLTVGKFAWVFGDGRTVANRNVNGRKPDGFAARQFGTALIVQYLAETSNLIPKGFPITLHNEGDFWALVTGSTPATRGAAVYANNETGDIVIGAAPAGTTGTGSIGATFTATGTGTSLAVTSLTGYLAVGDTIAGVGVPAGTKIIAQVSGTAGAAGTYTTSVATTAAAATVTSFGDTLNVTAASGSFDVGDVVSGTGVPTGAAILKQLTGTTGGAGTYQLDDRATAYAASTALTVAAGILTPWVCGSDAAVGELVKITTWGN